MKLRVAHCSFIYRKALRLSRKAQGESTIGQMVNLLSNDVNRFDYSAFFVHYFWVGPLQFLIVLYISWASIGPACFVGGKIWEKVQLREAAMFTSKTKINILLNNFLMERIQRFLWSEEKISKNFDFIL